ncbi:hypothetical protein SDJN03_11193, partial [Cucurbita argyrosperma subsp. sororia]
MGSKLAGNNGGTQTKAFNESPDLALSTPKTTDVVLGQKPSPDTDTQQQGLGCSSEAMNCGQESAGDSVRRDQKMTCKAGRRLGVSNCLLPREEELGSHNSIERFAELGLGPVPFWALRVIFVGLKPV